MIYKKKDIIKILLFLASLIIIFFLAVFIDSQKNIVNKIYSENKKFLAISKLENGVINIYKKKIENGVINNYKKRIENDDKYKKILEIDNDGNILYISIQDKPHKAGRSKVYFNDNDLNVNPGVHNSAINFKNIFAWSFFHYLKNKKDFYIYFYDTDLNKKKYLNLGNKFPKSFFFLNDQSLYIETFDGRNLEYHIFNIKNFTLNSTQKINRPQKKLKEDLILTNDSMSKEEIILINFINEEFDKNDPKGILSALDNYEGRLSWYVSKKLEALINIHNLNKEGAIELNKSIDLNNIINRYIKNILKSHEKLKKESGWPTKKYSIDKKTKLYLSVNNSAIFYPLLLSINSGLIIDENIKKKILNLFEIYFDHHEKNFLHEKNVYIIDNDYFHKKGIEPLNFQSLFGTCLIEAFKATKNNKYLDKALLLANSIKTQIILLDDGSLIWPYDYDENYNIMNQDKKIGEDFSHASINLNFLLESSALLGKDFYFDDIIGKLNHTLNKNIYPDDLKFNRKLNDGSSKSYKLPSGYWLKLDNKHLNDLHLQNLNIIHNYFDNSRLLSFSLLLTNISNKQKL